MKYIIEVEGVTPVRKEALKHDVAHMVWTITDQFLMVVDEISKHVPIEDAIPNLDTYREALAPIIKTTIEDNEDSVRIVLDASPLLSAVKAMKQKGGGLLQRLRGIISDTILNALANKLDDEIIEYAKDLEQYGTYVEVKKEG
jgi:hypothetical protein